MTTRPAKKKPTRRAKRRKEQREFEEFYRGYVKLSPEMQAYILRLMEAYIARTEGWATAEDLALIAAEEAQDEIQQA